MRRLLSAIGGWAIAMLTSVTACLWMLAFGQPWVSMVIILLGAAASNIVFMQGPRRQA